MATRTPAHIVQPAIVLFGALACMLVYRTTESATAVTATQISQVPLTVAQAAHPQVVIALGNSESMDGNLSGAIMAGSGSLSNAMSLLNASSSPVSYTIPNGFTPPVDPGPGDGTAPYTSKVGPTLVDNSPSRLNVAKAGITTTLNNFMQYADFGLVTYDLGGTNIYTTWVYEMSPPGGFAFTSTPLPGARYIANPCYQYTNLGTNNTVHVACQNIDTSGQVTGSMATSTLMQVDATQFPASAYNGGSSDDPLINDVLYAGGLAPVCLVYGGPTPANPYNTAKGGWPLSKYNANPANIHESYSHTINACAPTTFPTNAGFVPSTPQTMYIQRGFGYYGGQSATQGSTLVKMTTAGALPTPASVNAAIAQFTPFLAPETNSPGTGEIKAAGGQSALPGLLQQAITIFNGKPAGNNGCNPKQYVILLTDGLPTLDLKGHSWPPPGTVSGEAWGMTPGIYPPGPTGKTIGFVTAPAPAGQTVGELDFSKTSDQAVKDTVTQLQNLANGTGHVKTFVIGLGAGVDPTVNPIAANVLTAFAIAGGTGAYYPATDATSLANALQAILTQVMTATQSTSSTAVNSTGLNLNSVAYLAQFTSSDTYQDWTGNLNAWPIDPTTGAVPTTGAPKWTAQAQLDAQSWDTGRLIATWDPVTKAGTPFRWNPNIAPAGISSATAGLGLALSTFTADPSVQHVVNYLRGDSTYEMRNGGQFRNRTHVLGDVVDSAPLYVGAPNGLAQTTDYFNFAQTNQNRRPVIYVGADDGMLHAFDPTTGNELFAYFPNGVFNNLIKLVSPFYNDNHLFFVNGSPRSADVKFVGDGKWHTVLVTNLAAGGSTLFALDVTDPGAIVAGGESAVAQAALWEFSDTDMGLSYSEPAIAETAAGWMVLAGNGYNSPKQKPVLYGIEPQHGTTLAKIDLCAAVAGVCNTGLANGLSSVTAVNSYGQVSAPANTVYAGDLQGNIWRVDITNSSPANWTVSVIFQARDSLGNLQPITTVPAVTLNPKFPQTLGTMVFVGTGQMLGIGDLATTAVQSMYGIFDAPTGSGSPLGFPGIPTRSNLVQQFLCSDTTAANVPVRDISGAVLPNVMPVQGNCSPPITAATQVQLPQPNRGWFVDLALYNGAVQTDPGERIITDPEIESGGGLVFTTYQPNPSVCQGGGSGWLMVLNYATGGAFPLPELDTNSDGNLDTKDLGTSTGNPVPVAMSLGPVYASSPTLLPAGSGIGGTMKMISVSSNNVDSILDRGRAKQRISWWELRH